MNIKTCPQCKTEFDAKRADAKFCSAKCRLEAFRSDGATVEKKSVAEASGHVCSPQFTPPCWFKVEIDGVLKERCSREHWAWLTDGGPAGETFPNNTQRDCKPGVLQPDGTRKIYKVENK